MLESTVTYDCLKTGIFKRMFCGVCLEHLVIKIASCHRPEVNTYVNLIWKRKGSLTDIAVAATNIQAGRN